MRTDFLCCAQGTRVAMDKFARLMSAANLERFFGRSDSIASQDDLTRAFAIKKNILVTLRVQG